MPSLEATDLAHSLPEQIADRIAAAIIDESLAPGERLKEVALAESFGVSRAPVREALRILESRGLIRLLAQRGAQVTELSVDDVVELFQIRAVLMGLAAACVARHRDPAILRTLDDGIGQLERLARRDATAADYARGSYDLSIAMAAASGSTRLHSMLTAFAQQTARYTRIGLAGAAARRASSAGWRAVHDAQVGGDAGAAEARARSLVERSGEAARAALAAGAVPGPLPARAAHGA